MSCVSQNRKPQTPTNCWQFFNGTTWLETDVFNEGYSDTLRIGRTHGWNTKTEILLPSGAGQPLPAPLLQPPAAAQQALHQVRHGPGQQARLPHC